MRQRSQMRFVSQISGCVANDRIIDTQRKNSRCPLSADSGRLEIEDEEPGYSRVAQIGEFGVAGAGRARQSPTCGTASEWNPTLRESITLIFNSKLAHERGSDRRRSRPRPNTVCCANSRGWIVKWEGPAPTPIRSCPIWWCRFAGVALAISGQAGLIMLP